MIEIDQQITAGDQIQLGKRWIPEQAMSGEQNEIAQFSCDAIMANAAPAGCAAATGTAGRPAGDRRRPCAASWATELLATPCALSPRPLARHSA